MSETAATQPSAQAHTPLRGKTILVTRAREQAAEFIKLLEQLGASVIVFPTIHIVPPQSWTACDKAIENIKGYDAVILTSVNAAERFFARMLQVGGSALQIAAEKRVYAVGEKTRHAAEKYNIPVAMMPEVYDAKHLAIALSRSDVAGQRFLFPKGSLAGDAVSFALREHGANVDEVIVYETVQPSREDSGMIEQKLRDKEIDVITFFSPSSVSNFLAMIPRELVNDRIIAVIGNTTAASAKNVSLPVHIVAEHATSANLVASIVRYYE
jgi:uroporphyrinogen III methyltransferase/synthase